jgi:predicted ATPase
VFAGSWTLEAAEAVCAGEGIEYEQVLELLARLVDKSLVVVDRSTDEGPATACWSRSASTPRSASEGMGWRRCFGARMRPSFLAVAERAEPELLGPEQRTWFDRLERDLDNLRAALDWTAADPERTELGLKLASGLLRFWDARGHLREGRDRLLAMLARSGASTSTRTRAKALFACGSLMFACAYLDADVEAARTVVGGGGVCTWNGGNRW